MSVWDVTPQRERINFGECEILVDELEAKNGNKYNKITINIFPVQGSRNADMQTGIYFKFSGHTKPWDSDVLPAIRELVVADKIKNAPDINGKFVSWKWGTYRTYRRNDIEYWVNRANDEKSQGNVEAAQKSRTQIKKDANGREYTEKRYMHLLDVFADEATCQAAHDEHYGIDSSKDEIPGFESEPEEPKANEQHEFAAVGLLMGLELGEKFEDFFKMNQVLVDTFVTVENEIVVKAKEKFEAGTDKEEMKRWLLEELALPF